MGKTVRNTLLRHAKETGRPVVTGKTRTVKQTISSCIKGSFDWTTSQRQEAPLMYLYGTPAYSFDRSGQTPIAAAVLTGTRCRFSKSPALLPKVVRTGAERPACGPASRADIKARRIITAWGSLELHGLQFLLALQGQLDRS
jgi:hypothetical protein